MVNFLNTFVGALGLQGLHGVLQVPFHSDNGINERPSIAIIGAGAAGSSTAYHLRKYLDDKVGIHIYEANERVGGRTTTLQIENYTVELGASIFVEDNRILRDAVREFNLTVRESTSQFEPEAPEDDVEIAIWDGTSFQFELSNANSASQAWQFWRKFGILSPYRTRKLTKKVVQQFVQMYDDVENYTFSNIGELFEGVDLAQYASTQASELFDSKGISKDYEELLIQALTRVNYSLDIKTISALAALVSLAAESGVYAVNGGNYQIFESMIEASGAKLSLNTKVNGLKLEKNGKWILEGYTPRFDYVVLAGPYQFLNVSIDIPSKETFYKPPAVDYIELYTHYVLTETTLNASTAFGSNKTYQNIISIPARDGTNIAPAWTSISHQAITDQGHHIYKAFSRQELTPASLSHLFGNSTILNYWVKKWFSYPEMTPDAAIPVEVEIAPNLLYTGGMDPFVSTMETNALAGRNVARLIKKAILSAYN